MMWYKERHWLPQKWFIIFPWCVSKVWRTSDILCKSLIVHTVSFLLWLTLKLHTKYYTLDTLSSWEMQWYTARRCIHCCWSVSYSSLDALVGHEELLVAFTSPLCVNPWYFRYLILTLKLHIKCRFWGTSPRTENGMICYEERYPLLLKWFITFISCISNMGGTCGCI